MLFWHRHCEGRGCQEFCREYLHREGEDLKHKEKNSVREDRFFDPGISRVPVLSAHRVSPMKTSFVATEREGHCPGLSLRTEYSSTNTEKILLKPAYKKKITYIAISKRMIGNS